MAALSALLETLSGDQVQRGRQFERIVKWYLENDPVYRGQLKQVWLHGDWPGRRSRDIGVDLIAEAQDGGLWAIQAKAYAAQYRVKKADIDSFLSASAAREITCRLVVATTTGGLGPNAQAALREQPVPVRFLGLGELESAGLDWPASPEALLPLSPAPRAPRPHQRAAVEDIVRGFEHTARGKLVMACGTGKTLIGLWIAERLGAQRTLVLVPSLTLLQQVIREWMRNAAAPFPYLAVCSDQGVADGDALIEHSADLGIPVTTDAGRIAAFLAANDRRVVFATYQSSPEIAKAMKAQAVPAFDLAIADEAHRCAGVVGGPFTAILDQSEIRATKRLFTTATPRYFTGRVRHEAEGVERVLASMDDEAQFGAELHRLSFGQAIRDGLLTDYQIVVLGVDDSECRRYLERGTLFALDDGKPTDARTLAAQVAVLKAMRKYGLRRMLSYHSRVSAAGSFARTLNNVRSLISEQERPVAAVTAEHVSGAMPVRVRQDRLSALRDDSDAQHVLVTNARCLTEGIDVPALDGVVFVEPRRSVVDIAQAVGRAIRLSESKTKAMVLIPVYFEAGHDAVEQIEASAFAPVWDVVRALRAHDEELAEQLDELRRELGARPPGKPALPRKLCIDVPEGVPAAFTEQLALYLVTETTASWEEWFGRLQSFVAREGHARVEQHYREGTFPLGQWVSAQRAKYANGSLAADRAERLAGLSGWTWEAYEADWEQGLRSLRSFVARGGHARPPSEERDGTFALGAWVMNARSRHKARRLSAARVQQLESFPGWTWNTDEAAWDDAFRLLERFVEREGNAAVPQAHREGGMWLGRWVNTQRRLFARDKLAPERERRLVALPGWTWTAFGQRWEEGLHSLKRFVRREGHTQVPIKHIEDGFPLGRWVADQRERHAQGTLSEDRIAALTQVEGWMWNRPDERWDSALQSLQSYVAEFGHARVPTTYVHGRHKLGSWAADQRKQYAKGDLPRDRARSLEALPGWNWRPIPGRPKRPSVTPINVASSR